MRHINPPQASEFLVDGSRFIDTVIESSVVFQIAMNTALGIFQIRVDSLTLSVS